ncbi:MAG: YraN family protein, partial [Planctomycetaceae bacterium]
MWGPRRRSDGADHRGELGRRGEDEAARYLRGLGYRIVGRRERVLRGDIDIVALDDRCVVFVEVRSRSDTEQVSPDSPSGIGSTAIVASPGPTVTRTPKLR